MSRGCARLSISRGQVIDLPQEGCRIRDTVVILSNNQAEAGGVLGRFSRKICCLFVRLKVARACVPKQSSSFFALGPCRGTETQGARVRGTMRLGSRLVWICWTTNHDDSWVSFKIHEIQ